MGARKRSGFHWNQRRSDVAVYLAAGHTIEEAAAEYHVNERNIYRWKADAEFAAELDRLSLMVDVSNRSERLRLAMRMVRDKIKRAKDQDKPATSKDLLDWLIFIQSETDGARIDAAGLIAALAQIAPPLAPGGPGGSAGAGEGDAETE